MKKIPYLVVLVFLLAGIGNSKTDERYNPLRPDGACKKVKITIEWDNPDLPTGRRESLKEAMEIRIAADGNEVRIGRQQREAVVPREDYIALWKVFKKNKLWELEENALTDPRPIGVPNKTFILKMEGVGQKYFNVDVENSKSKHHFRIINAVEALCKKHLGI